MAGDPEDAAPRQDRSRPRSGWVVVVVRLTASAALGLVMAVIVGVVGLLFLEPCPVEDTGGGALCFRQAPWVGVVETAAFVFGAGFAWWISGLLWRTRLPKDDARDASGPPEPPGAKTS